MALFDALIDDMASRFRLGSNAAPLVREGLSLIAASQGGVRVRFKPMQDRLGLD